MGRFYVRSHWGIQDSSCTLNVPMFPTDSNRSEKPSQNRLPLLLFALNKLSSFIICLFSTYEIKYHKFPASETRISQKNARQPFYLPKTKRFLWKIPFYTRDVWCILIGWFPFSLITFAFKEKKIRPLAAPWKNARLYKNVSVKLENVVRGQVCSSFSFHSPSLEWYDSKVQGSRTHLLKIASYLLNWGRV